MIRNNIRKISMCTLGITLLSVIGYQCVNAGNAYLDTAVGGIDVAVERYVADELTNTQAVETQPVEAVVVQEPTVRYPQFDGKLMANVNDYLNIRAEADENSEAIGKLPHGAVATVLEKGDAWTKIESGSVTGYVKNDYLLYGDDAGDYAEANCRKVATVNTETLKVREDQSADSACLTMIGMGDTFAAIETNEAWTLIYLDDSTNGYVSNEFVDVTYEVTEAISAEEERAELERQQAAQQAAAQQNQGGSAPAQQTSRGDGIVVGGDRNAVVQYATSFVGNPYVYGGTSLTNGTDCSGFTKSVYAHFGVDLNRSSRDQIYNGTNIAVSDVQPGDLLFYSNGTSSIRHVAIYIGNGQIVHASTPSSGIIISSAYSQTPCGATRVMN